MGASLGGHISHVRRKMRAMGEALKLKERDEECYDHSKARKRIEAVRLLDAVRDVLKPLDPKYGGGYRAQDYGWNGIQPTYPTTDRVFCGAALPPERRPHRNLEDLNRHLPHGDIYGNRLRNPVRPLPFNVGYRQHYGGSPMQLWPRFR